MLGSVEEGARKYQDAAVHMKSKRPTPKAAQIVSGSAAICVNLAAERERQFEVMDKEAQRCRAGLMAPVPPKTQGRKK